MLSRLKEKLAGNGRKDNKGKNVGTNNEETMHIGFQPYRKKSKHLLEIEQRSVHTPNYLRGWKMQTKKQPGVSRRRKTLSKILLLTTPEQQQQEPQKRQSLQSSSSPRTSTGQGVSSSLEEQEERIKFHPEDEVKEYIVQSRSYKPSITKDPLGLDIFANADLLWLEHANRDEVTNVPILDYNYNVFDDSEQRILSIRPSNEDVQENDTVPTSFLVLTSTGTNLCQLQFRTSTCCSSKELVAKVVLKGGKQIGSVAKMGNFFAALDHKGRQIMRMPITTTTFVSNQKSSDDDDGEGVKNERKCCFFSKKELELPMPPVDQFVCNVYVTSGKIKPFGTIRGNGLDGSREFVNCMGEPNGFYFIMNEAQRPPDLTATVAATANATTSQKRSENPLPTLVKLYVFTTLVALTVYYSDPPPPPTGDLQVRENADNENYLRAPTSYPVGPSSVNSNDTNQNNKNKTIAATS